MRGRRLVPAAPIVPVKSAAAAVGSGQEPFFPGTVLDGATVWKIVMAMNRLLGLVLLVIGVVLLAFAWNASNAPVDQVTNAVTGHFTDQTMWFVILGAAGVVGGGLLAAFGSSRR